MRSVAALVFASACFYSSSTKPSQSIAQPPPGQPAISDPDPAQPGPFEQAPTVLSSTAKPTTTTIAPVPQSATVTAWSVFKTPSGCATSAKVECTTGMCRPPPEQPYDCPGGVKLPATIVSNGDSCAVDCPAAPCHAVPCPGL